MNGRSNMVVRSFHVSDDDSRRRLVTGSTHQRSAADAGSRPTLQIQTVEDVRRAISAVDRGVFGVTPVRSGDASGGVEDPAVAVSASATQAVLQPDPAAVLSRSEERRVGTECRYGRTASERA